MARIPRPTVRGSLSMIPGAAIVVIAFSTVVLTVSSGEFGLCGFSAVAFVLAGLAASVAGIVTRTLSPVGFGPGFLLGVPACVAVLQGFIALVGRGVQGFM